ncbi:MAG: methyltransferase domain-containing protein [Arenicellales bacterium]|jgi:ubiquinone/menaquinone biosynthesis C-methylase UbiE|nr:methyltransferase domain-containing protein [Arenicellales bacterium]HJL66715.1 methyltransferase domain-containing protein [Arenicellales bacterium]HJP25942.1 methyltransferase domain-containing protein [Arenicellales bacterium]|tara:strand:- start:32 stop:850 length:819 start_codon:yes stop_codon:yes gene_type:complete
MTTDQDIRYVHGYSARETERLYDQAGSVKDLIHSDTAYPVGSVILEAGCGVGAQTLTLAQNSPAAKFISIDWSEDSLALARDVIHRNQISNVDFFHADIFDLPLDEKCVDHLFVCHLLEHLVDPVAGLLTLQKHLKKGGSITVFEGDHGSCYFHPETKEAVQAWNCLIEVQKRLGANSLIGRELFPLMKTSGFRNIHVVPKMLYIDQSSPELRESFVIKTIIPMVEGVKAQSLSLGLIDEEIWQKGIEDLHRTQTDEGGVFCYTFFKGTAIR